jgi:hypothetical protein
MPYIELKARERIDEALAKLVWAVSEAARIGDADWREQQERVPGLLNYAVTRLMMGVVKELFRGMRYWIGNMLLGMLDAVGKEFYYRVMRPYEDSAVGKNGDIPEYAAQTFWGSLVAQPPTVTRRTQDFYCGTCGQKLSINESHGCLNTPNITPTSG